VDVTFALSPIADGTRVNLAIDFEGRGIGKLFAIFARRSSRQEAPQNLAHLKANLEQQG
jgi:hypothetical protein